MIRGHLKIDDNDYLSLKKNLILDVDVSIILLISVGYMILDDTKLYLCIQYVPVNMSCNISIYCAINNSSMFKICYILYKINCYFILEYFIIITYISI